jgi:branched-chain amino acid transport system ATP-binding protein
LKPRPGEIRFKGRPIGGLSPYRISRTGVGFVPQERGIFSSLTVRENLTVAARKGFSGEWTLKRIYGLFPRLEERAEFRGMKLSGGEQQMLAIARALMLNPELLILDEPSEGLAPLIVKEIISILQSVRSSGVSILLVEQNVHVALSVADRHYVMSKGAVCYTGSTEILRNRPDILNNHIGI